jgi:opacity protein-like surface antigen
MGWRAVAVACVCVAAVLGGPRDADAQGRFLDPRRQAGFMVDANLSYTLVTGDIGDSIAGGLGGEAAVLYQFEEIPLRIGGGAGYSHHGIDQADGSADKLSLFASAIVLLFSDETDMIPYLEGRVGWTQFDSTIDGSDSKRSGVELAAVVGVDIPVAEKISVDVSGLFSWINAGDAQVPGGRIPDSAKSGTAFALRAGAFFFF